jgi:NAD(P)-dependent dehydrogenase (short-subunit alcohol dehydrogenase family)
LTNQAACELSSHGVRVHAVETGEDVVEKVFTLLEEK